MKLTLAACAATYLCATPLAWAGWAIGVDHGTSIAQMGILPVPGYGVTAFPGGSSRVSGAVVVTAAGANNLHQAVLNGKVLTPKTYQTSGALNVAIDAVNGGVDVVGFVAGSCTGRVCQSGEPHAAAWTPGGGFVDLHPDGAISSVAQGLDDQQDYVGWYENGSGSQIPMLWTKFGAGNLPFPDGWVQAAATAISGGVIGGYGEAPDGAYHPLVWFYDGDGGYLTTDALPSGAVSGEIVTADPAFTGRFGGAITTTSSGGQSHAAYWPQALGNTAIDLHPAIKAYVASSVMAMRTIVKVGLPTTYAAGYAVYSRSGTQAWHAMVWNSSDFIGIASIVDLHSHLPTGFVQSVATGMDSAGNIEGAAQDNAGVWHDITWHWK